MLWLAVFIIAIIVELFTLSLVSIWFSAGALISLLLKFLGISLLGQIIGFIIASILTFIIFRPILIKHIKSPKIKTNMDRYIGKTGEIVKEITPYSYGQVKINGQIWTATSKDKVYIKDGSIVEVVDIEGVKLIVVENQGGI